MKEEHRTFWVSAEEMAYLKNADFVPASFSQVLDAAECTVDEVCCLLLDREAAEQFRSVLTDQLARVGFGLGYELTPEGELLEELIDRFHPAAGGGTPG